jgi:hypothetical protein
LPDFRATATRTRATRPAPLVRQPRSLAVPVRARRLREAFTARLDAKRETGAVPSEHALAALATGARPAMPVTAWTRAISPASRGTPKPVT